MLATLGFAILVLGGGAPPPLANGGFEEKSAKDGAPAGWTLEMGAQNGATKPGSKVELDPKEKHGGKASLRFSGDASTRGWRILEQLDPLEDPSARWKELKEKSFVELEPEWHAFLGKF